MASPPPTASVVETLRPEQVARLRPRQGAAALVDIRREVEAYPGRSVWAPETLEYALLAPWRHRPEIAHVRDLQAVRHAAPLLRAAIEGADAHGAALVLVIEMDETRRPAFYERVGLRRLEDVITFELDRGEPPPVPRALQFRRPAPAGDDLRSLLALDHAAFPWLWWNSAEEFRAYAATPGVALYLGERDGEPLCYLGLTMFAGWGHLDRIAVHPRAQGRGLGGEALRFAIDTLRRAGARRIGLSTQRDNPRSQRLYARFGFRRSPGYDYRLFGAPLRPPATDALGGATRERARLGDG